MSALWCNLRWRAEKYRPGWPDNVIVREDLLGKANIACPSILDTPSSTITIPCSTRRRHLPGIIWPGLQMAESERRCGCNG